MSRVTESCPICSARGEVVSVGVFGFVAHCSDCYDADPESPRWRRVQGHAERAYVAVERWLEDAREIAAIDEIPAMHCSYHPESLFAAIERQAAEEFERQRGFDLVDGWLRRILDDGSNVDVDVIYLELPCACE